MLAFPGLSAFAEFKVNTTTAGNQTEPAAAMDSVGNFVVVWTSDGDLDGDKKGVFAQRYNASGVAQGAEFRVNTFTTGDQNKPAVAMDANGNFVVVWASNAQDGDKHGIYAQRFNSAGVVQGSEFLVNSTTTGNQDDPAAALDANGNFVITWKSDQSGTKNDVYARRYNASGVAQGGEFRVNTSVTDTQDLPTVALDTNGNFVIAWKTNAATDGAGKGVFAQRYNASGVAQGGEFQVNTTSSGNQDKPSAAMATTGEFVIAWVSGNNQDGDKNGVYAQRFNASGVTQGGEFLVNTITTDNQDRPSVAMDSTGAFTIVWESNLQDSSGKGIYAKRYSASGAVVGGEFLVNSTTANSQDRAAVAMSSIGDLVVTWEGNGTGDSSGVFGQFYQSVNDAPVNNVPGAQTTNENTTLAFSSANGNLMSVSDADALTSSVQVALTATNGVLTLNGVTGLTFSVGDGATDSTMTFSGSLSNINSALSGMIFTPTANFNGAASVQIVANDLGNTGSGGALTDTDTVNITVNAVNDPPVITSNGGGASASLSMAENTTLVTTVTSTDVDGGTAVYSISGGADAAKFTINSSTGVLTFVTAPNYESPTDSGGNNVYDVTVQVSDGSLTDTQAIAVTVTNANEAPAITSDGGGASASLSMAENTTAVTTVTATDVDAGASLTYSISGGVDAAKFTINSSTGVLTFVTAPNYESPTDSGGNNVYDVTVQVSDGSLTDTQAIAVTVTNVGTELTLDKSHSGNFSQGQSGAPYTLTVSNAVGADAVSNNGTTVTVTDTLPSGLTPTAASGTNWLCSISGQDVTCTRAAANNALSGGSSYPDITVTVNVATTAGSPLTNTASVSLSGQSESDTSNNSDDDSTTITQLPDLTMTKGHSGSFNQGQTGAQYTLTVSNGSGSGSVSNTGTTVTVTDTLPSDLTPTAVSGTNWSCSISGQDVACTRAAADNALNGGSSYPDITLTVDVAANAATLVTNTASVSLAGQSESTTNNNTAVDPTNINAAFAISGTIFEDVNYGGGAGRSLATSSGVGSAGARVELYDNSGNFVSFTTTDSVGTYTFTSLLAADYTVRVVNSTVASSRTGGAGCGVCLPVQTYRTDGAGSSVTSKVGGENPALLDAGNGATTLADLTTGTTTAQSITSVTLTAAGISGVDFGFNFDTIVNAYSSGQGSLRQFITNANALGDDTSLAQSGFRKNASNANEALPTGKETSIFMIPSDADPLGRAQDPNYNDGVGVAEIEILALVLPQLTGVHTIIDGTTQTVNIGDTNTGQLGAGGTVGVDALSLSRVYRPEVQLSGASAFSTGISIQADHVAVRGLALYGFGTASTGGSGATANVYVTGSDDVTIEQNIVGTTAGSFTDPGGSRSQGHGVELANLSGATVRNNLIGFHGGMGVFAHDGSYGYTITNNEIRENNQNNNATDDGIGLSDLDAVHTVSRNLLVNNGAVGIDVSFSDSVAVTNNTIAGNGVATDSAAETAGVRFSGDGSTIGSTLSKNLITANYGPGVMVTSTVSGQVFSRNSIYANGTITNRGSAAATGQVGIDLQSASDDSAQGTAPFVTLNDSGDSDSGGNGLLNFPILQSAIIAGDDLELTGYARPGAMIELFIAATDPSGFGEGQTYLATVTEGCSVVSGACAATDTDSGTGTYGPGAVNSIAQGTDTTNAFRFFIPLASLPGVSGSTHLTATATLASGTSEFSGLISVADIQGFKSVKLTNDADSSGDVTEGDTLTWTVAYANVGGADVQDFQINDVLPTGVTVAGAPGVTTSGAGTSASGHGSYTGASAGAASDLLAASATLGASGVLTITITTTVDGGFTGVLSNQATGTGDGLLSDVFSDNVDSMTAGLPAGVTVPASSVAQTQNSTVDPTTVTVGSVPPTDLAITKTDGTATVTPGGSTIYTIVVTNNGPTHVLGATVTDTLPAAVTSATWTCSASAGSSCPASGSGHLNTTVNLLNGGAATFTVTANLSAGASGSLVNTASVTPPSSVVDPTPSNDSATDTDTFDAEADLVLSKGDAPDPVNAGANITYTLTTTNDGPSVATDVSLQDSTPTNTTFVSATPSSGGSCSTPSVGGTGAITCTWTGSTAVSGTRSVDIVVRVNSALSAGSTITNSASTTSVTDDPNAGNNTASTATTVSTAADMAMAKTDSPDPVNAGAQLTYMLTATNQGPSIAADVGIADATPTNTTFVSATPSVGGSCTTPAVGGTGAITCGWSTTTAASGVRSVEIVVKVNTGVADGAVLSNAATVSSTTTDPDAGNNSASASTVVGVAAELEVTKTGPVTVTAGANAVYTLTLMNHGPSDATNVQVADPTPSGLTFLSNAGDCTSAFPCSIGTVPVGESRTITATYAVPSSYTAPDPIENTVTVTSTTADPGAYPNVATAISLLDRQTALTATKAVADLNGGAIQPGDVLEYTITFLNTGASDATNVFLNDLPDAHTTLVNGSVTTSQGTIISGNSGTPPVIIDLGAVPGGSTATMTFRVTIHTPLPIGITQVSNQGAVSGDNFPTLSTDDPATLPDSDATASSVIAAPVLSATKAVSLLTDADGNSTPSPGDTLLYTVVVTNSGNTGASNVAFTDIPDTHTTLVNSSVTASQGVITSGNSGAPPVTVQLGTLGGGAVATITFQALIDSPLPAGVSEIGNQGSVSSTELPTVQTDDPSTGAMEDATVTTTTAVPDVVVTKTDSLFVDDDGDTVPSPGDTLLYSVVVRNDGNLNAAAVVFNDTLDPNTTLLVGSVQTDQGAVTVGNTAGDTAVQVNLGTVVGGGGSVHVTFRATINLPVPTGVTQVSNQALVSGGNFAAVSSDDPATVPVGDATVTTVTATPVLSSVLAANLLTDADGDSVPSPGDTILYTVTVQNSGNIGVTGVTFSATPDANAMLVTGSVQTSAGAITSGNSGAPPVAVNLGPLPGGGTTATITFRVMVTTPLPAGVTQVSTQGTISCNELSPVQTDDPNTVVLNDATVTVVTAAPVLVASKAVNLYNDIDHNSVVTAGDTLLYTVTLQNTGNSGLTNVIFTDTPDAHSSLVVGSVQSSAGTVIGGNSGTPPVSVNVGAIPGDETVTITFRVTLPNPLPAGVTQVSNQGVVTSTQLPAQQTDDPNTATVGDPTTVVTAFIEALKTVSDLDGGLVQPGDTLEYTITLMNSHGPVSGVTFTDNIPGSTSYVSGSLNTTKGVVNTSNAPTLLVQVGALAANESVTIRFRVTVNSGTLDGTTITNQGSVDSDQTVAEPTDADGHDSNGDQPTTAVVGAVPTPLNPLYVEKIVQWVNDVDGSGHITAGDRMRYTLLVYNLGATTLTNVSFVDALPAGLTAVSGVGGATGGGSLTLTGSSVAVLLPSLAAQSAEAATFEVTIEGPLSGARMFTNQGTADSDQTGPVASDGNGDSADGQQATVFTATAGSGGDGPRLDVQKRWRLIGDANADGLVNPGETIEYQISLRNTGATPAFNVALTDPIPPQTTLVAGSVVTSQGLVTTETPNVQVNLGTVNPSGLVIVSFRVVIDLSVASGTVIANQAVVSGENLSSTVSSDDNADVSDGANPTRVAVYNGRDMALTKAVEPSRTQVGHLVTYTLTATNLGAAAATNVTVTDTLPSELSFVSATPGQGSCSGAPTLSCTLGSLNAGTSATVTVTATVLRAGTIVNTAAVSADQTDTELANNAASASLTVASVGDVRVKVWVFTSRHEEVTSFNLCLASSSFGFIVLQQEGMSGRQQEELQRRGHKVRYLTVADDLIPSHGYLTLAAQAVYQSTDSTCQGELFTFASTEAGPLGVWAILQDVGQGFFATEIPTPTAAVDAGQGTVNGGVGLIPGGNTIISRFDVNPRVNAKNELFIWLAENAGEPSGHNRPADIIAALACEDGLAVSTALHAPDGINVIDPETLTDISPCVQTQQYRGVLRFTLPVAGYSWSQLSQAGEHYRENFLGYNLECNEFVRQASGQDPSTPCRTTGYLMGDPAVGKLVPYFRIDDSLATIIGIENVIGNAGPNGP
jgi:uncharacterized repeat protein (TIGR01451 family)/fimbrial isopeptide formation D2 family protein